MICWYISLTFDHNRNIKTLGHLLNTFSVLAVYTNELEVAHGRASGGPVSAMPAAETSAMTSVGSDTTLIGIEDIASLFVEHPEAITGDSSQFMFDIEEALKRSLENQPQQLHRSLVSSNPVKSLANASSSGQQHNTLSTASHGRASTRRVELPLFSGKVEDYWEFREVFSALMDEPYTEHMLFITQLRSQLPTDDLNMLRGLVDRHKAWELLY